MHFSTKFYPTILFNASTLLRNPSLTTTVMYYGIRCFSTIVAAKPLLPVIVLLPLVARLAAPVFACTDTTIDARLTNLHSTHNFQSESFLLAAQDPKQSSSPKSAARSSLPHTMRIYILRAAPLG
mmetsp:Transcript_11771/g.17756  ORF Transcript_11771/g.17756 Transcript_11771/m.17756 type:complete len:125 (-) Transcript_11771:1013-1387(-)